MQDLEGSIDTIPLPLPIRERLVDKAKDCLIENYNWSIDETLPEFFITVTGDGDVISISCDFTGRRTTLGYLFISA